jgi:hypothetical protein
MAQNTKYPKKPCGLKIPSEKEKMEGGTYSPPQEYRVKKRAPCGTSQDDAGVG